MPSTMKYAQVDLGTIEAILNKLGGVDGAQRFLRGDAEVVITRHIIDCDAAPYVPDGWKVEEHTPGGQFEWSADSIELYLSDKQKGGTIEGNKLRKELAGMPVLSANVLDYLLKNPQLIPDEWKGEYIFFFGTIYRRSDGLLCGRCLYWSGESWGWDYGWLDVEWDALSPAAVRK